MPLPSRPQPTLIFDAPTTSAISAFVQAQLGGTSGGAPQEEQGAEWAAAAPVGMRMPAVPAGSLAARQPGGRAPLAIASASYR